MSKKSKLLNVLAVLPMLMLAIALLFAACSSPTSDEPTEGEPPMAEQPSTKAPGSSSGSKGGGSGVSSSTPSVPSTTYIISITVVDDEGSDSVTFSPASGKAGTKITISYTVANVKGSNELAFSGTAVPIMGVVAVGGPESGTRTYTVNASDAVGGAITITAKFTHTDLTLDAIEFDPAGPITVEYGDGGNTLTKAIKPPPAYLGSGAITYTSSDPTVATVDSDGVVTILKAGFTDITADKAADSTYASSSAYYRLEVGKKGLTISGVTATNRAYDGTDTVALAGGTLSGVLPGETVGFALGDGTIASADASASAKAVTTGITLTGADAGNYTLTQPTDVTVTISKAAGAAVGVPTVSGTPTDSSITVNAVSPPGNGQGVEYNYSLAGDGTGLSASWSGTTLSGLTADTTYYIYARSAENGNYNAGAAPYAVSAGIKTDVASVTWTVSFNSNGGTAITSETVSDNSVFSKPTDPTKAETGYYDFGGWYREAALTNAWAFASDTVTENTTLYAKWIPKKTVGDTGPGGGIIFYVESAVKGFTLYMDETDDTGVSAHYLEAAPSNITSPSPTHMWAPTSSPAYLYPVPGLSIYPEETDWAIGRGKKNTALILDFVTSPGTNAPAAAACAAPYNAGGSKTDWFLPSKNELNELYNQITLLDISISASSYYWSSSQNDPGTAWLRYFFNGHQTYGIKNYPINVRAVRAF